MTNHRPQRTDPSRSFKRSEPDYIDEAYQRVLASDVGYPFVIDTGSLR